MSVRFLALIVVYGVDPNVTSSLQTLLNNDLDRDGLRILIWDNSPSPDFDKTLLERASIQYVSTPENIGLSKIYNIVIADYLSENEYLLLLDQDSVLPSDFLSIASDAISDYPGVDLFLPMIKAGHNWVSPLSYFFGWGRYWKVPKHGLMKSSGISAINSGMIISSRYLLGKINYDERVDFYGTDTQFMVDYCAVRPHLFVMSVKIEHDLSFFSDDIQTKARKFKKMRMAYRFIYEDRSFVQRSFINLVMLLVSLTYAFRYRDWHFLEQDL